MKFPARSAAVWLLAHEENFLLLSLCAFLLMIFCHTPVLRSAVQTPAPKVPSSARAAASLSDKAWAVLGEGAASKSLRKRTDAIAALASMEGDTRAATLITEGLSDKSADVRRIAAAALGTMGAKEAIPALKKATRDKDPAVSFAAAKALWKMGDESGIGIFYAVLLGNRRVSEGMVTSDIDQAKRELHDPMALVMIGVNESSGALLGPFSEGITIAEALAKDRSASARALSATLLGQRPSARSEKILEEALADKNVAVRAAAAQALGGFDDPALATKLAPLMSAKGTPLVKPVDSVRYMAAAAIVRLLRGKNTAPVAGTPSKSGARL